MNTNIELSVKTIAKKVPWFSQDMPKRVHLKKLHDHKLSLAKRKDELARRKQELVNTEEDRLRNKAIRRERRRREMLEHVLDRSVVLRKKLIDNPSGLELVDIDQIRRKNDASTYINSLCGRWSTDLVDNVTPSVYAAL